MKYVILLNGISQHGKNTVGNFIEEISDMGDDNFKHISSRDIATKACQLVSEVIPNFDIEERNEKQRQFLSDMKMLFDKYYNVSFKYLFNIVDNINDGGLVIYHVRELENINNIKLHYENDMNVTCVSLVVRDPRKEHVPSNMADLDASNLNYEYDYTIINDSDLESLKIETEVFLGKMWYETTFLDIDFEN